MCDKIVSDDAFKLRYCYDRYKAQEMSTKAIDDFLEVLKFIPDQLVTSKMNKKPIALHADDNILYFNEDSGDAVFSCNEMGILSKDLNNINLDDINYDEDDPDTIIHIRPLTWHILFEKRKALLKS